MPEVVAERRRLHPLHPAALRRADGMRDEPRRAGPGGRSARPGTCVLAPNADMMTLDGTNTWVLRDPDSARSVVVDPGPSIATHLDAIDAVAGDVAVVLLTHHHADHSEAAREYAERHGCGVRALDPAYRLGSEGLGEGDVVAVGGLEVHVVATPGHTADSLSFVVPQDRAVLTGDTVLGRGTTVVAHPDGQLGAYLSSLQRLHALCGEQGITTVWPGHGPVIDDALGALDFYLAHRAAAARPGPRGAARPARDRAGGRLLPPRDPAARDRRDRLRRRGPGAVGRGGAVGARPAGLPHRHSRAAPTAGCRRRPPAPR